MIHFLLDDTELRLQDADPNGSVLDWLRETRGLTGTKEGCASGDCGACTVVVADAVEGDLRYQAINACVTPLGSLHGKQLITVEHLSEGGQLHPTQQAMVDCHGSQCGFCTPGFVMSLFAHLKTHRAPERHALLESLGGNLCRCTGYRPIVEAGVRMYDPGAADRFDLAGAETASRLEAICLETPSTDAKVSEHHYLAPDSAADLGEVLARHPGARLVAGGTDLMLEHTQGLVEFETLVYTGRVAELQQLEEIDGELHVGAAVTYSDCCEVLCGHWPDLGELIERLGSRQIRNQGTLGGNVGTASPIGDMPPVLLALGARLRLRSAAGERELPIEGYFLDYRQTALQPGEFIQSIILPLPRDGDWLQAYKISKRLEDDISAVCAVFWLRLDGELISDVRLAFGGMAAVPKRASAAEQVLLGQTFDESALSAAAATLVNDFAPISDMRASADYRLQVARNLFQRLWLARGVDAAELRVARHA
ncbi:MAG: xanthine dehydrogenase small subunit [Pseudomonadota bacterium]